MLTDCEILKTVCLAGLEQGRPSKPSAPRGRRYGRLPRDSKFRWRTFVFAIGFDKGLGKGFKSFRTNLRLRSEVALVRSHDGRNH